MNIEAQNATAVFICSTGGDLIYASEAPEGISRQVINSVEAFIQQGLRERLAVERLDNGTLELRLISKGPMNCVLAIYSWQTSDHEHWRITELKKLSMELESILETSHDGIVVADGEGTFININTSYERISGLGRHQILGRSGWDIVKRGYVSQSATILVLESGEPVSINQVFDNGRKSYVTANPLRDETGKIFKVVTNVRDTTEIQNLRDRLVQSQARLNQYSQIVKNLTQERDDLIFRSLKMRQVKDNAVKFAQVDAPLLIIGETGVGKEVVADYVHKHSLRSSEPFLKINCAAIPEHLLEAELFGYEEGAFTGASKRGKPGLLEMANNGMILLDEVGELPSILQAKLLRFVEHQEFYRVGGKKPRKVNVRLLAATNRDLEDMVEQKTFRVDLFYRLNVLRINIPGLRDRPEDILVLVDYFLQKANQRYAQDKVFDPDIYRYLMSYGWPGNVRELEHMVERLVIMSDSKIIEARLLPPHMLLCQLGDLPLDSGLSYREAKDNFERSFWRRVQTLYPSYRQAARALKVNHSTVIKKLGRYGGGKNKDGVKTG